MKPYYTKGHTVTSSHPHPTILLVDNGSLRPQAVMGLRAIAAELSAMIEIPVEAVSLLHSHKIPAEALAGKPATIVRRKLRALAEQGMTSVVILPAFIGPSNAVTEYLPKVIAEICAEYPALHVSIADTLCGPDPEQPDTRIAQMLCDHIHATLSENPSKSVTDSMTIAVVDHGTPNEIVNRVRNAVTAHVTQWCAAHSALQSASVIASSMERRPGDEYAFNDPLLENIEPHASMPPNTAAHCIVAMLFILPGRHAGEGGDVADICDALVAQQRFSAVQISPLLGEHPLILDILRDRLMKEVEKYA